MELQKIKDLIRAGMSGVRIPVKERFFVSVQTDPEIHPIKSVPGLSLDVKRSGLGVDYPLPSSAEFKEKVELYLYPPLGLRGLF
jgi:hypothetical protein